MNSYICTLNSENRKLNYTEMAVTQLKRKARRNRAIANNKVDAIKKLVLKPIIKKVDVEELKAQFAK